jgi:hypothetical protein
MNIFYKSKLIPYEFIVLYCISWVVSCDKDYFGGDVLILYLKMACFLLKFHFIHQHYGWNWQKWSKYFLCWPYCNSIIMFSTMQICKLGELICFLLLFLLSILWFWTKFLICLWTVCSIRLFLFDFTFPL